MILGPLLIILLAGLAFTGTELQGVNVGLYYEEEDNFINTLTSKLEAKSLGVRYYDNEATCVEGVKSADVHLCIGVLKKGNPKLVKLDARLDNAVVLHVDYSNLRLIYIILNV
ncbi:MAG: hypothetical protein ACTSQG_11490, partial [Promethearchaeota archaeon]